MSNTQIDLNWRVNAACKGMSVEEFYPTRGEIISKELAALCETCPVKGDCLNHALKHEHYGFWAGTSEKQRIDIRKKLNIFCQKPESLYLVETRVEKARAESTRQDKIRGRGRKVAVCGTRSGYGAHLRKNETPCEDCKKAQTDSSNEFNLKKKLKEEGLDYE